MDYLVLCHQSRCNSNLLYSYSFFFSIYNLPFPSSVFPFSRCSLYDPSGKHTPVWETQVCSSTNWFSQHFKSPMKRTKGFPLLESPNTNTRSYLNWGKQILHVPIGATFLCEPGSLLTFWSGYEIQHPNELVYSRNLSLFKHVAQPSLSSNHCFFFFF